MNYKLLISRITLSLLLMLTSIYGFSQNFIPGDDTLRSMFNGDFPKNEEDDDVEIIENEETIEEKLRMKILAAWLLGEKEFILQTIEKAIKDNNLDYNHFTGMMLMAEPVFEIPQEKITNILSIKQAIYKKYGSNKMIKNYFIIFDIIAAQSYFEPDQIDSFLITINPLLISGDLSLDNNVIRNLFDLNVLNYEIKEDSLSLDSFVTAMYQIYPNVLEDGYLLHHFNSKNYKIITQKIKHTEDNPFLIIQAAISHYKLGQKDSAALFFDKIIIRYNAADDYQKESGSLPCVFEDGIEGTCSFPSDAVQQMLEFYLEISQKEKACTSLQFLKAIVNSGQLIDANEQRKNNTLKGPKRLALEENARKNQTAENKLRDNKIQNWTSYCEL